MALKETLGRLKDVLHNADAEVERDPMDTYQGRLGRQKQARIQSELLKSQYKQEMMISSLFMVVTGSQKDEFSKLAASTGAFVADSDDFYKDLVSRVPAELYMNKQAGANIFDVMGRHLEDKAMELEIKGYPMLLMKDHYVRPLKSKEDLLSLTIEAVNEQVGSEIVGINAINSLLNKAIEVGHSSRITPIVLLASSDKMALDLMANLPRLTSKVLLINAGKISKTIKEQKSVTTLKEVSEKNVVETLTNISKSIK